MTWAKLDDQFFLHPKVIDRSKDAKLLFLAGLTYCAGQLTDGLISPASLRMIAAQVDVARDTADELLTAGLWEEVEGGYHVHDYLNYNPTGDEVRAKREARSEAGRVGGLRSGETRAQKAQANHEANEAKREAIASAKHEAKREANTKQNRTPSPYPYPYPVPETTSLDSGIPTSVTAANADSDEQSAHERETDEPAATMATTTSRKRRNSEPLPQDSEAMRLATLLRDHIVAHTPTARVPATPAKLQPWAQVVDLMLRLDRRAPPEVEAVITFATADEFWRANILSPGALRDKYDRLNIKRQTQHERQEAGNNGSMGRATTAQASAAYRTGSVRGQARRVQANTGAAAAAEWSPENVRAFNDEARAIRQQFAQANAANGSGAGGSNVR